MIKLSPTMPPMNSEKFIWTSIGDQTTQKIVFNYWTKCNETVDLADWLLCNSTYDLEPATFAVFKNFTPIGPLLARNRLGKSTGYFWPEDTECLTWLDKQPEKSVIYIAFGSFTVFDQVQFQELALGLELTNKPFLWVVRQDISDNAGKAYPDGFKKRVQSRGHLVGWAPQQLILQHPSIACFVSHCGWNSTVEGVSNGIPFLCWPYFADQFNNQSYICDEWKIGLELKRDDIGIIRKDEIKNKVDQLLSDQCFKIRVKNLQEKVISAVSKGGSSNNHLSSFIEWIKQDIEN
ncbi:glycosyltransferase [Lithospermum erythrorhizon]|uniref:Glycosyltransferase n=1 Tax=Lithospermum erythrorhizon TaxID=34254 RepID=A0AAV3NIE0_LITER